MSAQPKEVVEKILSTLGFPATVAEHILEDGVSWTSPPKTPAA